MPGDAYLMRRWWLIDKLRRSLNVLEDTEGGFIFEDREGELGFHLANYRAARVKSRTFVSAAPGANEIRIFGNPRREIAVKDVHNIVAGNVRQFDQKADETVFTSEDAIPIGLGQTLELVSVYPVNRGAVTELNSLAAGTDWNAVTNADGTGTNRNARVTVEIALMDFNEVHMTLTYPNVAGYDSSVYVTVLTVKGTVLTIAQPLRVVREDTVSKERYRPKTRELRETWVRSVADMEGRADAILERLASPERRVSLDWHVDSWDDFLALDLSDRVGISLPTIAADGYIEAIALRIPLDRTFNTCTMDISVI